MLSKHFFGISLGSENVSLRLPVRDVPKFVIGDTTFWIGDLSFNELILTLLIY